MKIIRFILTTICSIVLIPVCLILTLALTWYVLPAIQTTFVGNWALNIVTNQEIFIITICLIFCALLFIILKKIITPIKSSKLKNFYTHFLTWLIAGFLVIESIFTFFVSNNLQTLSIELNIVRKVLIGLGFLAMFLYGLFHKKFGALVDRKIQAYDTAKELNANGRSSVIWVQILKLFDLWFPEINLLCTLCFTFSLNISLYFVFILIAFIIPFIGNIICDKRVKKEAARKLEEEREVTVNETAEAVVDILKTKLGG